MTDYMEHEAGTTPSQIKDAEMEFRKNVLAEKFGWSREEFNEKLEELKDFLTQTEMKRRKKDGNYIMVTDGK